MTHPEPISTSPTSTPPPGRVDPVSPLDPISPWPPEEANRGNDLPSAKEVYGSLAVLLTYIAYAAYLVWAFAPAEWLDWVGWTWYPDREWAIIIPCWLMVVVWLTYWGYSSLMVFLSPSFSSPSLIADSRGNIPPRTEGDPEPYYWKFADPDSVPEAVDLPIDLVNRVLYPPRRRLR